MSLSRHNLALAFAAGIALLAMTSAAEAGFVSASIEGDPAAFPAEYAGAGASTSAPAEDDKPASPRPRQLDLPTDYLDAILGGSPGSMSTTSSGSGPSSVPAAALNTDNSPTPNLQLRLAQREEPYHPRFIKSRLFRPPRS